MAIKDLHTLKTPVYCYDMALLQRTVQTMDQASKKYDIKVNYALKANYQQPLVDVIRKAGFGAECVSGNEIALALESGFAPSQIFFDGVGKSDDEIILGLNSGIAAFVVESLQEIEVLAQFCKQLNKRANLMLRINPDIDARTHKYISTGEEENKFGIAKEDLQKALDELSSSDCFDFLGLQMHVGSQITDLSVFEQEGLTANEIVADIESRGFEVKFISLGGGLGVDYNDPVGNPVPDFDGWLGALSKTLKRREGQTVTVEPGRSLVAQCGSIISRVLFVKPGARNFLVLDSGMNNLIRPALYQAYHKIDNMTASEDAPTKLYDVVGPICESSDVLGTDRELPESKRGDFMIIRSTGAYGCTMSTRYNLKDIADSIYV